MAVAQAPRDSAGIVVRHYPRGAKAPAQWTTNRAPLLSIGGAEGAGPTEFSGIMGAVRTSSGHIVVADGGANELRVFDARGTFLRSIGRKGGGPGEFDPLVNLLRSGDTLLAVDGASRIHAYSLDGALLRFMPRPIIANIALPGWMGTLSSGANVYVAQPARREPAEGSDIQWISFFTHREGAARAEHLIDRPSRRLRRVGGQYITPWLGPGNRTVVKGRRVCASWSATWEITCYNEGGRPTYITSRNLPDETLTQREKDAFTAGFRATNLRARPPATVDSFVRAMVFADERPKLNRIELTESGELWVGPFIPSEFALFGKPGLGTPDTSSQWSVIGTDGRWLADVTLPARFRMLEAGNDYVLGISRDEDDVERITLLRLHR